MFQGRTRTRRVTVPEALEILTQEEEQKLVDMDSVVEAAIERVEQSGIIFLDEIDKIAGPRRRRRPRGPTSAGRACSATSSRSSRARR